MLKRRNRNLRATCLEIGLGLKGDESTFRKRLHAMNLIKKLDKWIPHELTEENKLPHFSIANSLVTRNRNDPFIDRIVTCDEKWVNYDNSRRSGKWVAADKPDGTIPKKNLTLKKILMTVWWTARGIIHTCIKYIQ